MRPNHLSNVLRLNPLSAAVAALLALSGCATTPSAPGSGPATGPVQNGVASAAPPAAGASASAARPPEQPLKAFDEIIKGAERQAGFVPIWRKDEKVWLEIPKERIGQPFLMTVNISNSVGERGLYASQMGPEWMAEFRRIGNTLQLVAKNTDFRASGDAALGFAVQQAFSDSLLGSTAVLSQPEAKSGGVLIDASFLLADLPSYSTALEAAFRLSFSLDKGNSYFESVRADEKLSTLSARIHFSTPRISAPPLTPPPVKPPPPPETTPDPRSLFIGFVYNFAELPAQPMAARIADPRLGHFAQSFTDLSSDLKANPRVHFVDRWRLEKKDPAAALSEPVKPITYWLDRNIPARYREAVKAGILEWNKAFERIGFKNAIVVEQQPDDAKFDNMDAGHASIRWFVGSDVGFAIGPSHSDPRSGEILDADIGMSDVFGRGARRLIVEDQGVPDPKPAAIGPRGRSDAAYCNYAHEASIEMNFALDLLEARGDIAPDSPEADAFVNGVIKDVITHEVGHTLGLKHNFKASTTITRAQLEDMSFTAAHGISGSVMDYNAYNLPLKGERAGSPNNTTLGSYDYWAIEYAYKPVAAGQESAELGRIAGRSTDPLLAYADDADADGGEGRDGIDPLTNRFDLGDDPLAYYKKRLTLSRELWERTQERGPRAGEDPLRQRRVLLSGFRQLRNLPELASKYVGGMYTVRDLPGSTDRATYKPVEPARQREALQFLAQNVFSDDSFRFRPEFLTTLAPDFNEWNRQGPVDIAGTVLRLQATALDRLMSGGTANRVLELPGYVPENQRRGVLSLNEIYGTLQSAIWSELKTGTNADRIRRNLQREHLKRVINLLTKGGGGLPADALSLLRMQATQLQGELRGAAGRGNLTVENRAHLQESLGALTEALRATMQRS